jgi:hydrogenase expression/formation protein HypC
VPSHPGTDRRVDRAARQLAVVAISGLRRQINAACIVDADHPVERCVGDWNRPRRQ